MRHEIAGIHHVTAIGTDPRGNVGFYRDLLGLRLVKRTVNFDDPGTYHLYYGDEIGTPGSIMTFFPWLRARRGHRGPGQATVTAFSVPDGSLAWWSERLQGAGASCEDTKARFGEESMRFLDPDGLQLELVADAGAAEIEPWLGGDVPRECAVRGLHSVTLSVSEREETQRLLSEVMGLHVREEEGNRARFSAPTASVGSQVDLVTESGSSRGLIAAGTVHHVAWRVANDDEQLAWRERLVAHGMHVTPVLDRKYFRSIYFREPGGVLFELATDRPGFTVDEEAESLGSELRLPGWLEGDRDRIEAALPSLEDANS